MKISEEKTFTIEFLNNTQLRIFRTLLFFKTVDVKVIEELGNVLVFKLHISDEYVVQKCKDIIDRLWFTKFNCEKSVTYEHVHVTQVNRDQWVALNDMYKTMLDHYTVYEFRGSAWEQENLTAHFLIPTGLIPVWSLLVRKE